MLVTNRDDIAEVTKTLRSHGMTTLTWDRHRGHAHTYDVVALGFNYRIDEIRAALGLVQLRKLAENNIRRSAVARRYREGLRNPSLSGIEVPFGDVRGVSAHHIFPILLPGGVDRDAFMDAMRKAGVQTSIHYPPIHRFTYYRRRVPGVSLPITEAVASREVTLPLYPMLRDEDTSYILSVLGDALTAARADTSGPLSQRS